ncbi:MAG: hypothetical protein KF708_00430 [Pirellulales bacterium]|nr:hypothetical protein [Pirellulales bacterium]
MSQANDFGATPPAKAGMGSGMKVFLILLAVFGGLSVLCCGGFGLFSYFAYSTAVESLSQDPAKIEEVRSQIAEIAVPPDFKPEVSMNLKVPFTDQHVRFVVFTGPQEPTMLMLMSMDFAGLDAEQIRAQMEHQLEQQGRHEGKRIHVEQYEEREFVINGKPAKFYFGHGLEEGSNREAWQVVGSFEGKSGPTGLILIADQEAMSEEQITQLIESIK